MESNSRILYGIIRDEKGFVNGTVQDDMPDELKDKNRTIYVYCRSGHRSKLAAAKLVEEGYTNIIDCGGILDWTGEIEK